MPSMGSCLLIYRKNLIAGNLFQPTRSNSKTLVNVNRVEAGDYFTRDQNILCHIVRKLDIVPCCTSKYSNNLGRLPECPNPTTYVPFTNLEATVFPHLRWRSSG
jgi:hypothetical protein